eukprot:416560-Prorocentrum_minimum.AAC.3
MSHCLGVTHLSVCATSPVCRRAAVPESVCCQSTAPIMYDLCPPIQVAQKREQKLWLWISKNPLNESMTCLPRNRDVDRACVKEAPGVRLDVQRKRKWTARLGGSL